MLVLPVKGQKHGSVNTRERVRTTIPNMHGDKVSQGTTARLLEKVA